MFNVLKPCEHPLKVPTTRVTCSFNYALLELLVGAGKKLGPFLLAFTQGVLPGKDSRPRNSKPAVDFPR